MNATSQNNHNQSESMPKAYQEGFQDFYGRDFIVTPDVLIPRPETEQIIDAVLNLAGKAYLPGVKPATAKINPNNLKILDIGTGSGCIAITLQLELPEAKVTATDISPAAIKIAQKNVAKYNVTIPLIISHLLEKVKFTPDIVVANLPYVDQNWSWLDRKSLDHEPVIALYADNHGLSLIYKLITQASARNLKYLVLEADPCQHDDIENFADQNRYKLTEKRGFVLVFEIK